MSFTTTPAEGNHLGPTLSFRGIDNQAYYRLMPEDPRFYLDFTGTGNTFNLLHPRTLQLVMDSLRYWVNDMHVDGFRFDLASTLARDANGVNKLHAFFEIIHQDPVISQVKLIAEPWDVGEGGYQVGNFPVLWAEWNGKYRDAVRSFWKGDEGRIGELAYRLTGSPDLYQHSGRRPYASINFITAHDGFTLNDLVSYNDKHNEANGEDNRDGDNNNHSWNYGAEGPTDDPEIKQLRRQQRRNFLTTLFLSQGVPMLAAGDEWARTQKGNNNAYCQDNEISWLNWNLDDEQKALLDFTKKLIQLPARSSGFPASEILPGPPDSRLRDSRRDVVQSRRQRDDGRRMEFAICSLPRHAPERRHDRRADFRRRTDPRQYLSAPDQRASRAAAVCSAGPETCRVAAPARYRVGRRFLPGAAKLMSRATKWKFKSAPRCCSS